MNRAGKAILCFLSVFVLAFVPVRTLGKKGKENDFPIKTQNYETVLTVWNIDTFEGGKGSRTAFLSSAGKGFGKGVIVLVRSQTLFGAKESLADGDIPDMISFGGGCEFLAGLCVPLTKKEKAYGGSVGKTTLAAPWCAGGYFLFTKSGDNRLIDKVIVSSGEHNFPLAAKCLSGVKGNAELVRSEDGCGAFLAAGENAALIGTQRDVIRLERKGVAFTAKPLGIYSDLFQYLAICTENEERFRLCEDFLLYVLTEKVQSGISSIGMFPVTGENPYRESALSLFDLSEVLYTASPFLSEDNAAKYRDPTFFGETWGNADADRIKSGLKRL